MTEDSSRKPGCPPGAGGALSQSRRLDGQQSRAADARSSSRSHPTPTGNGGARPRRPVWARTSARRALVADSGRPGLCVSHSQQSSSGRRRGGGAGNADLPGNTTLTPGTKRCRFARRRPMPDQTAFFCAAGGRRVHVALAVRFAGGAYLEMQRTLGEAPAGDARELRAVWQTAPFACCPCPAP
jgi:hypothetical protein